MFFPFLLIFRFTPSPSFFCGLMPRHYENDSEGMRKEKPCRGKISHLGERKMKKNRNVNEISSFFHSDVRWGGWGRNINTMPYMAKMEEREKLSDNFFYFGNSFRKAYKVKLLAETTSNIHQRSCWCSFVYASFFYAYTYIVVSFHPSASPTSIIRNKCSFSAISIGCNFHYFIVFLLSFLHRSPFAHTPSRWSAMELWNNIKIYVLAYEFCISS